MVAPLFAALPLIFQAISSSIDLFSEGKKVYEQVTGKESTAATPAQLESDIVALPLADQVKWIEVMDKQTEQYRAQTERLVAEQGEVNAATLVAMGPEAAKEVAILRMTTRPKITIRMSYVVLMPFYILCIDTAFMVVNNALKVIGIPRRFDLLADVLFMEGSIYFQLYSWAAPTAASVIIAYMTLKSGEHAQASNGQQTGGIGSAIEGLVSATRGLSGVFTKRKK